MTSRWHNRFGSIIDKKADFIWSILRDKNFYYAFSELVDMGYWNDNTITTDFERETFLYREFMNYYEFIMDLSENEFKDLKFTGDKLTLVNIIKIQLDKEILKVKNHDYEFVSE